MMYRAAVALLVLAAPAFAQHGGAHSGSFGNRGFAGHAGLSSHPGFSRPGSFARPAPPVRYGASGNAGLQRFRPPNYSSPRFPSGGNRFLAYRPPYRPGLSSPARGGDRDGDRDRFRERRRQFNNWYSYIYPAWLGYGYPYVIDPGFYDWGEPDDSANDQGGAAPEYTAPYPGQGYEAPGELPQQGYSEEIPRPSGPSQPPAQLRSSVPYSPVSEQPLTVIFKGGRAPAKMQNYMMTTKVLTDLDSHHYEQIPLDQIDVAATQQANRENGVAFEIPSILYN
jgi:hypothetical protein